MTKTEAEQIARLLQQYHHVFGFAAHALLPVNRTKTVEQILKETANGNQYAAVVFGFMGLAFVQAHDGVFKPLNKPAAISAETDPVKLGATTNKVGKNETPNQSCLRHLRNCFGHNLFTPTGNGPTMKVHVRDEEPKSHATTFEATCEVTVLAEMAERVLIAAHKEVAALATS